MMIVLLGLLSSIMILWIEEVYAYSDWERRIRAQHRKRQLQESDDNGEFIKPEVLDLEPPIYNASFPCFSAEELNTIFTHYNISRRAFEVGRNLPVLISDWAPGGYIAQILMKELFGFNATAVFFYADSFWIIDELDEIAMNFEIFYHDFDPELWDYFTMQKATATAAPTGSTSLILWAIHETAQTYIEDALGENSTIYTDWWRSYTNDELIQWMTHTPVSVIPMPGDEGDTYPCMTHGCINSTFTPNICLNSSHNCSTLMNWVPEYNNFVDADLINQTNMRLRVAFVGYEFLNTSLKVFADLVHNNQRVLYSMWSPSLWISSGEFIPVGLPFDTILGNGDPLYKIWSSKISTKHRWLYGLVTNIAITKSVYDFVLKRVWNDANVYDSAAARYNYSCLWLKQNPGVWTSWLPDIDTYLASCSDFSDRMLQSVASYQTSEDWKDFDLSNGYFLDVSTAKWAREECLKSTDDINESPGIVALFSITSLVCLFLLIQILIVVRYREHKIFKESAWKLCVLYLVGGIISLTYIFVGIEKSLFQCYLRVFFQHTGFIVANGILFGKTWRLWFIFNNAVHMKQSNMTDLAVVIRVALLLVGVWAILAIYLGVNPFKLEDSVYQHRVYRTCNSDHFFYVEDALYIFYGLGFLYIGRLAYNLRTVTKQWHRRSAGKVPKYNDGKWVAIISWNVVLSIALLIFFTTVHFADPLIIYHGISATQLIIISMNMSLYIIPKVFRIVRRKKRTKSDIVNRIGTDIDTENSETNNNWRYLVIDRENKNNLLEDVRLIKQYLEPLGFNITEPPSKNNLDTTAVIPSSIDMSTTTQDNKKHAQIPHFEPMEVSGKKETPL